MRKKIEKILNHELSWDTTKIKPHFKEPRDPVDQLLDLFNKELEKDRKESKRRYLVIFDEIIKLAKKGRFIKLTKKG